MKTINTNVLTNLRRYSALTAMMLLLTACASTRNPSVAETKAAARSVAALNGGVVNQQGQYASVAVPKVVSNRSNQASSSAGANLNVGDVLDVNVFKVEDLSAQNLTVESSGTISLPLVGSVAVAGLSISQAEQRITQK